MKPPIFVRELSEKERQSLQAGLRSRDTFVMRRSQILLASARGNSPPKIAQSLGCASQTVRNAIRAFNEKGLDALIAGSSTPKRVHAAFDANSAERLRGMLHRSPREFGYERVACGLLRWPQRLPSRRASPKRGSRGRPSAPPSRVFWAYAGSGPSGGSPPRIPCTNEKKAARPTDGDSRRRPSVGHRLFGRMLVEPGGAAHFERLLRGERAPSHDPTVGRQRRPRAEGHILLRPLPSTARRHMDKVRRRQARELHKHAVSLVVLRGARKSWQEDPSSHLGQRKLAHLQGGQKMARQTQSRSQGERLLWGKDRQLPSAEAEPVAELHRAQMGSWQA